MFVLNYGLFERKYYFGLFCIFERPIISSVLKCGLFQNVCFVLDICGFSVGQVGHTSQCSNILVEDRISEGNIL